MGSVGNVTLSHVKELGRWIPGFGEGRAMCIESAYVGAGISKQREGVVASSCCF